MFSNTTDLEGFKNVISIGLGIMQKAESENQKKESDKSLQKAESENQKKESDKSLQTESGNQKKESENRVQSYDLMKGLMYGDINYII